MAVKAKSNRVLVVGDEVYHPSYKGLLFTIVDLGKANGLAKIECVRETQSNVMDIVKVSELVYHAGRAVGV